MSDTSIKVIYRGMSLTVLNPEGLFQIPRMATKVKILVKLWLFKLPRMAIKVKILVKLWLKSKSILVELGLLKLRIRVELWLLNSDPHSQDHLALWVMDHPQNAGYMPVWQQFFLPSLYIKVSFVLSFIFIQQRISFQDIFCSDPFLLHLLLSI